MRLITTGTAWPTTQAAAIRPSGQGIAFVQSGANWVADSDVFTTLTEIKNGSGVRTGWKYVNELDETENYDANGRLLNIVNKAGLTTTLGYDARGNLTTVTDPFGHQLTIAYGSGSQAQSLTDPAGQSYQFSYDTYNNLRSITFPGPHVKQFLYNESGLIVAGSLLHALTGIIDENGNRF